MSLIKKHWPLFFLSLTLILLFTTNYTPNTYLTGWDNLHPELNFSANIKRSIFSTWQEYQGLGLLAGMAHAADLPRQIILYLVSLPFRSLGVGWLRYFWHFLMLTTGTFSVYFLSRYLVKKHPLINISSALFYLLNFGTIQLFNFPFEPFSTFWGLLPVALLFLLKLISHPTKKNWLIFAIINIFLTPAFYLQTIFLVYIICLLLFLILSNKSLFFNLKIILLIIFLNSFWLLPNLYWTITSVSITKNAMMNLMVTDQFFEQNLKHGNIFDFARSIGQYYDLKYLGKNLFTNWQNYFKLIPIIIAQILIFLLLPFSFFSKNKDKKMFIAILFFCCLAFLSATFPFNFLNQLFNQIPLVNQIFRNSFTKLIVPLVLSLSILLTFSLDLINQKIPKRLNIIVIFLILIISYPSFTGQFIHSKMKNKIPQNYFELFDYLKTQSTSKRIANLPQYNFWGWNSYSWGTIGSGFLWYGIDQPIIDRAFDVWSPQNEDYYWQLHYAQLTQNPIYFDQIIKKYNISYIFFDPNVIFPDNKDSGRISQDNEKLITGSSLLSLEKQFGNIKLYKVKQNISNNFVSLISDLPTINNSEKFQHLDYAFQNYSDYQTKKTNDISFPFNSLFTNRPQNINFQFKESENSIVINKIPISTNWQSCSQHSATIMAIDQEETRLYPCPNINLSSGNIIKITYKNISSRLPLIKIFSQNNNRLIADTKIFDKNSNTYYYIVPPISEFDQGINIVISSLSFSKNPSINEITDIQISDIPYNQLSSLQLGNNILQTSNQQTIIPNIVTHPNQTFYKININQKLNSNSTLVLYQSYSPDWLAFYFNGIKPIFLNHTLINNWANGYTLSDNFNNQTIYIFFWPQLLQYFGFILLILPISFLVFQNHFPSNHE